MNKIDNWWLIDNSGLNANIIARGDTNSINMTNRVLWDELKDNYYEK